MAAEPKKVRVHEPLASPSQQKIYTCKICNKIFHYPQSLGGHSRRHKKERELEPLMRGILRHPTSSVYYDAPAYNAGGPALAGDHRGNHQELQGLQDDLDLTLKVEVGYYAPQELEELDLTLRL